MFEERYARKLNHQRRLGLYRNPPEIIEKKGPFLRMADRTRLSFASNDYLGLGADPGVQAMVAGHFARLGPSSSSSRLVSANFQVIRDAEARFAAFFGYEDALFFSSGFQANLALIATLFDRGDRIFFDKHVHASTVKGLALSKAAFSGYRHNALDHLEKRLNASPPGPRAVITEGLFSMDGDSPDMAALLALKKRYVLLCLVDEAHSYGVLGPGGRGVAGGVADVAVGAMGKAFGLFGAVVLLPRLFKDYLLNFAAPLIYSTALPEAHARSAADLLDIIADADDKRKHLTQISRLLRQRLEEGGFRVKGEAQILSVEIGDETKTMALSKALYDRGIFVFPARFPTVPAGRAILRISLTAMHEEEHIHRLADTLIALCGEAAMSLT
jgi:8-amino-7-oxononanoate synthase